MTLAEVFAREASPAPDLRALVRARMLALGITQAALAERLTARRGGQKDSHVRALSRWRTGASDITTDVLADVLAELGGSVAWDAALGQARRNRTLDPLADREHAGARQSLNACPLLTRSPGVCVHREHEPAMGAPGPGIRTSATSARLPARIRLRSAATPAAAA